MYKNILVPIDPSHQERHEEAFKMARLLSDDSGAKITALTVAVIALPARAEIDTNVNEQLIVEYYSR